MKYIYQNADWHSFVWSGEKINNLLLDIQRAQGYLFGKMEDLIDYINNDETNLLIKSAIVHLWFVILHPFEDGNGRISRVLTDMILA